MYRKQKGDMEILVCKDIAKSLIVVFFSRVGHYFNREIDGDMILCIRKKGGT